MSIQTNITIAAIVLGSVASAFAQTNGNCVHCQKAENCNKGEMIFKKLDANNDGKISAEEFKVMKTLMSERRAENGRSKFVEKRTERIRPMRPNNQAQNARKSVNPATEIMKKFDKNGDQQLSAAELAEFQKAMEARRNAPRNR